jgi:phytoene synthase
LKAATGGRGDDEIARAARDVLSRHARSFRWGSLFLPAPVRDDAAVLYAFCRMIDDAVDEAPDTESARQALSRIEADFRSDSPSDPFIRAFRALSDRTGIESEVPLHLIEGVRSDTGPVRIADDGALSRYCYRVAGTVGVMMCKVLGDTPPAAHAFAIDLGIAMQLTNICRDVSEDAGRDRVYLPADRLERHGVTQSDLVAGRADAAAVARVVAELLSEAERYYRSARRGIPFLPVRSRLGVLVAARIYRAIGVRLDRRHEGDALRGRTVVPWTGKVPEVLAALLIWLSMIRARGGTAPHDPALHRHLDGFPGARP